MPSPQVSSLVNTHDTAPLWSRSERLLPRQVAPVFVSGVINDDLALADAAISGDLISLAPNVMRIHDVEVFPADVQYGSATRAGDIVPAPLQMTTTKLHNLHDVLPLM